ncbi:MAG: DUF3887 domain-containing protein [Clostridiales bacterium]|jgi:hypothetical protein|nr:DUF3887 domain-containing protein [Clostridiales bacterium]
MKKSGIRPLCQFMIAVFLFLIMLNGCGVRELSEDFDKDEIKKQVEVVIELINNRDSQGLLEMCNVQMKEALTEDVLGKVYEAIGEGGEYEEIKDVRIAGMTDKNSKEELAVVIARAKYEIKTFTFTITFTKQMKLAGLYFK